MAESNALAEYADANGNTFQLTEADAKRLGYTKAGAKAAGRTAENKVISGDDADAVSTAAPTRRRTTSK